MTSSEHMARCQAMRGGVTESERDIIADLAAAEAALKRVRESRGTIAEVLEGVGNAYELRDRAACEVWADHILAAILAKKVMKGRKEVSHGK